MMYEEEIREIKQSLEDLHEVVTYYISLCNSVVAASRVLEEKCEKLTQERNELRIAQWQTQTIFRRELEHIIRQYYNYECVLITNGSGYPVEIVFKNFRDKEKKDVKVTGKAILKEETKETVSFLKELLDTLEKERGLLYIGSGENRGFLQAMDIVTDKLNALEWQKGKRSK